MGAGFREAISYYSFRNGKVVQYVGKEPKAGATNLPTKEGEARYYNVFDNFTAFITGFSTKETEFAGEKGLSLIIAMEDEEGKYQIELNANSGYFTAFASTVGGADLSKQITLVPTEQTDENGKKRTGMLVCQVKEGETKSSALKWLYTKENPNGCPPVEELLNKQGKGTGKFDSSDKRKFLLDAVMSLKVFKGAIPTKAAVADDEVEEEEPAHISSEADDELPF